jgi:tRNA(fMet)-specific endonuclease VapC
MFVDTSFCVDLIRERSRDVIGPATAKLRELDDTRLVMSVFVLCELHAGARICRRQAEQLRLIAEIVSRIDIVYPDESFPPAYGEVVAHLRSKGTPLPVMDVLIGTMARLHGMPLLTKNLQHFSLIPGLALVTY